MFRLTSAEKASLLLTGRCVAGFRVGGVYTYNQPLIRAYDNISAFSAVSNLTQWHLLCLLNDTDFVDDFLLHNQAQLENSCKILTDGLDSMGVPYHKPEVRHCFAAA